MIQTLNRMTIPTRPAPAPPQSAAAAAAANANASIEQLRLQLEQQQRQQQQHGAGLQKLSIKLPPPPKAANGSLQQRHMNYNNNNNNGNINYEGSSITRKFPKARYAPATNWDDSPFETMGTAATTTTTMNGNFKKVPPPRPPPPKVQVNGRRAPATQAHSAAGLLTNIFQRSKKGGKTSAPASGVAATRVYGVSSGTAAATTTSSGSNGHTNNISAYNSWNANWSSSGNYASSASFATMATSASASSSHQPTDGQLISFDSPPSSPTFTQKSNSDCVSVDSFSSDSNFSSPHNGSVSQPESGFEDDFSSRTRSRPPTTSPLDPWEAFEADALAQNHSLYGSAANIGTAPVRNMSNFSSRTGNDNPLCNGKSLLPPPTALAAPTIIKPKISQKPKAPRPPLLSKLPYSGAGVMWSTTPPSPPMPVGAPPPPPPTTGAVSIFDVISGKADATQLQAGSSATASSDGAETQPHGYALYDFEGVEVDDLSFRENDKLYLLEQVSAEWYRGRTRAGCVGIFPANYIDVRVPLDSGSAATATAAASAGYTPVRIRCLYNFPAEMDGDLPLQENELVSVLHKINEDWLYGQLDNGRCGQFPANFLEHLPANIPSLP